MPQIEKEDDPEIQKKISDILVPGDKTIDITELREAFSGRNIDAKQLRKDAWTRKSYKTTK